MRPIILLCALVLGLAAAGCGGGNGGGGGGEALSKQGYEQALAQAGRSLERSSNGFAEDVDKALGGDEQAADAAADEIHRFQDTLRETADELEGIQPPASAAAAHDDLVAGLRGYADDLDALHDALHDGDLDAVRQRLATVGSLPSIKQLDRAGKRLRELGYSFQPT